ncbi:MAG: DUF2306 domain-containing protein [Candidatus Nanopelagicales bacterium]
MLVVASVVLGSIPLIAGALRLVQLAGGPALMPPDQRMTGLPLPVVLHILGATLFILLGAVQFAPSVRRRYPAWHRRAGRVVFAAGLVVAISALCMTLLYAQKEGTGDLLYFMRLFFSSVMGISLVLGLAAIRRRDIPTHRAWMLRAYAIGLAAGTQAFTGGISTAVLGAGVLQDDLAKGSGWVINLTIAEWIIRRQLSVQRRRSGTGEAPGGISGWQATLL